MASQADIQARAVSAAQAAKILGVHRSTVYTMIHSGRLHAVQISPERYIVPLASIDRLLGEGIDPRAERPAS